MEIIYRNLSGHSRQRIIDGTETIGNIKEYIEREFSLQWHKYILVVQSRIIHIDEDRNELFFEFLRHNGISVESPSLTLFVTLLLGGGPGYMQRSFIRPDYEPMLQAGIDGQPYPMHLNRSTRVPMPAARSVSPPARPPTSPRLPTSPTFPIARGSELIEFPAEGCSICSDDFNNGKPVVRTTVCKHLFHNDCLLRWQIPSQDTYNYLDPLGPTRPPGIGVAAVTYQNNTCPLCRAPLF